MDVRVVYGGGLENRWVYSPGGSNPSPSGSHEFFFFRRGAREAEGNGLLNRGRGNLAEGSNPSLSESYYEQY
jgi:hypothetical protein